MSRSGSKDKFDLLIEQLDLRHDAIGRALWSRWHDELAAEDKALALELDILVYHASLCGSRVKNRRAKAEDMIEWTRKYLDTFGWPRRYARVVHKHLGHPARDLFHGKTWLMLNWSRINEVSADGELSARGWHG